MRSRQCAATWWRATSSLAATRPNLAACIAKAREYDCAWINFDRDAETDATLSTYEW
jgi:hypothetical protein